MLTLSCLMQEADDLFDPVAGLNDPGVMASSYTGLDKIRDHLVSLLRETQPGGLHDQMCYHFQVATSLLMALFDGLAVYVEKKLATSPAPGIVYWAGTDTFLDPRFAELKAIREQTADYIIKGGITAKSLRNLAKHYLPRLPLADCTGAAWDLRFPINSSTKSGPVMKGLLFPLFNDARKACNVLAKHLGQDVREVQPL
jgi:hypothetical protein